MHSPCICTLFSIYLLYLKYVWSFSDCLFLPPSLLFTLIVSMAPKRKSTPSQNPLCSGASSSSNPTPSHIWFYDEDARKDFSENFSRQGVHSKCRVILVDFADIDLPDVIHSWGWESLCDVPITCPSMLIREFYSNMHGIDSSVPLFHTRIQDTRIVVTPQLVTNVLHVLRVEHPDYLECDCLRTMSKDEMISAFCECPSN